MMVCDVHFWRQGLILFADSLHCFGAGFMLSFPSVLNPAILSPNATDLRATPEQASWIAASQGASGALSFVLLPLLMDALGRRVTHCAVNALVAAGFLVFYCAASVSQLVAARVVQGLSLGGVYVTTVILAEYADASRRGYFISVKKSAVALGSLLCHALIDVCTWRQIALIGAASNVVAIALTLYWPESPAYLAMRGRFRECDEAHTWLKGDSAQSRKELEDLISAQTEARTMRRDGHLARRFWRKVTSAEFRRPVVITSIMTLVIECSGTYYNLAYIVQIMSALVRARAAAVGCALATDALTLLALCCSCCLITRFERRAILFCCGYGSVALMFLISCAIFLTSNGYIGGAAAWLAPALILLNSFITNVGVVPVCFTVSGEIFPLEHRGTGTCVMGMVFTALYAAVLKCTPYMLGAAGVDGTYAAYGACSLLGLLILQWILNETKDKTLQEIEDEIKGIKRTRDAATALRELPARA